MHDDEDDGALFPDDWSPAGSCLVAAGVLTFWGIVALLIIWWLGLR